MTNRKFEYLFLLCVCIAVTLNWAWNFRFAPDSSSYLSAAVNFVEHSKLFIWVNWPSHEVLPGPEPYTAFAPGYPLFLSLFLFLFRDPSIAAFISQWIVYLCLIGSFYYITKLAKLPFILIGTTILFLFKFWAFRDFWRLLLSEPLFSLYSILIYIFAVKLLEQPKSKALWLAALVFTFLASSVRWNGFGSGVILLYPLLKNKITKTTFLMLVLLAVAAVTPNILWYIRNTAEVGSGVGLHHFTLLPKWEKFVFPFEHSVWRWGFGHTWLAASVFIFPFVLFAQKTTRNNLNKNILFLTALTGFIQFSAIYTISLFVDTISPIDDRFLVLPYMFFIFSCVILLEARFRAFFYRGSQTFQKAQVMALSCLVLASPFVERKLSVSMAASNTWGIAFPKEQALWQTIKTRDYYKKSNYFLSDDNPIHQIFAGYSQRIIWDTTIIYKTAEIPTYWQIGVHPFVVVSKGSKLYEHFESVIKPQDPSILTEDFGAFVTYYKE